MLKLMDWINVDVNIKIIFKTNVDNLIFLEDGKGRTIQSSYKHPSS
jgi:hypothetical protein